MYFISDMAMPCSDILPALRPRLERDRGPGLLLQVGGPVGRRAREARWRGPAILQGRVSWARRPLPRLAFFS